MTLHITFGVILFYLHRIFQPKGNMYIAFLCWNQNIPEYQLIAQLLMLGLLIESSGHSHYSDVIMGAMASQITSSIIVYSTVYSGADQRKHQSSASLAFARGIHRWPVNSPHKWPVTWKMFPFDDVMLFNWVNRDCKCGWPFSTRPARLGVHPIWWRWHGNTKSLFKVQSSDV